MLRQAAENEAKLMAQFVENVVSDRKDDTKIPSDLRGSSLLGKDSEDSQLNLSCNGAAFSAKAIHLKEI